MGNFGASVGAFAMQLLLNIDININFNINFNINLCAIDVINNNSKKKKQKKRNQRRNRTNQIWRFKIQITFKTNSNNQKRFIFCAKDSKTINWNLSRQFAGF